MSVVETSFSLELGSSNIVSIYLLVRTLKDKLISVLKYTTNTWPVPLGHPKFSECDKDKIEIISYKP